MLDPKSCRENAQRCLAHAGQTNDPILKERLTETAHGWMRLAADFQKYEDITSGQKSLKRTA
jgi:hypothetical protein